METKNNIIVERPSERQIHFNYSPACEALKRWGLGRTKSEKNKNRERRIFMRKNVNTLSMYAIIVVEKQKKRAEAGRKIPLYKKLKLIKIFLL